MRRGRDAGGEAGKQPRGRRWLWAALGLVVLALVVAVVVAPEGLFRAGVTGWLALRGVHEQRIAAGSFSIRFYAGGPESSQDGGDGQGLPPVVLLHGLGGDALTSWMRLAPELARTRRVLAPDLLYGNMRALDFTHYGLDDEVDLVLALLDAEGIGRVDVVGMSVGGWVGLRLAAEHPGRVRRVAVLAPAGVEPAALAPERMGLDRVPDARTFYQRIFAHPPPIPGFVLDAHSQRMRELAARIQTTLSGLAASAPGVLTDAGRIQAPVLILWGEQDAILDPTDAPRLAEALSRAELELLPGCGHALVWDCAEEVARDVQGFLDAPAPLALARQLPESLPASLPGPPPGP